jgi:membrane-associated protein
MEFIQITALSYPKVIIETLLDKLGIFVLSRIVPDYFRRNRFGSRFFFAGRFAAFHGRAFLSVYPDKMNVWLMLILLFIAAVLGDAVGYYSGKKLGKSIFSRPNLAFLTQSFG